MESVITIEKSFVAFVLGRPGIADFLGNRFHWDKIPDNPTYPLIKGMTVVDRPKYTHQGSNSGKFFAQLDILSNIQDESVSAADIIKKSIRGYKGTMGNFKVRIFATSRFGGFASDEQLFRTILEVDIGYTEN